MNKLLNNLENKLKDVEQDITSLNSLKDNQLKTDHKIVDIDELIEIKENKRDETKRDFLQLKRLIKNVEKDKTISNLLISFESFKENLSFTYDDRLE
jgi:uncharacterized protein YhaN